MRFYPIWFQLVCVKKLTVNSKGKYPEKQTEVYTFLGFSHRSRYSTKELREIRPVLFLFVPGCEIL